MATPLQLCAVAACVANGGKYYKPRIVKQAIAEDGKIIVQDTPKLEIDLVAAGIKASDIELIRKGMWMSTNEPGGTSGKARLPNIQVSSKSGTAQTTDNGKKSNNSWVMSFAPYEAPKYAICVMVQNGGSGGGVCGPLVNLIYRGLFARDKGVRLPIKPLTKVSGNTDRIEKTIDIHFLISFDYKNMNKVMRVIKEKKLNIINQTMEIEDTGIAIGKIEIKTRKKNAEMIFDIFDKLFEIDIKRL